VRDLVKYQSNSRTHSPDQIQQVVNSIKEFGFTNPLLIDEKNTIIAGHCRLEAAIASGFEHVPCIVLDGLTEAQKIAYVIADNKLALNAGWDMDILQAQLDLLSGMDFDLSLTGFSADELCDLFPEAEVEAFCDEDECPDVPDDPITVLGDVWLLGEHRLMCGDSTAWNHIEILMRDARADMVFTDPPYNVGFKGRGGKFDVIKNDALSVDEFQIFIKEVCQSLRAINAPISYIWCNWNFYAILQQEMPFKACIVWAKNVFGLGKGYRHQHEFCLFYGDVDAHIKNESDLWSIAKDTNYIHPTQKPVALCERALGNHKKAINIVDLFGGSGSTLIACEKLKRKCFMMELDPKYCDVIIKRYENYSGKKAQREN
jgi:DNA modification methylase